MTEDEQRTFHGLVAEVDVLKRIVLDICFTIYGRERMSALHAELLRDLDTFRQPEVVARIHRFTLSGAKFLNKLPSDERVHS